MPELAERFLHTRIARSVEAIRRSFIDHLFYITGRRLEHATTLDHYTALAYSIRDRILARMVASTELYRGSGAKTVAYLSAEFLPGPHLANNILNLKLWDRVAEAMAALHLNLETILEAEQEPGLGNGGLGRLAACYMDSLATLEVPAIGYGIRYEYGIFEQCIRDGWQVEVADAWLRDGNPWELPRQLRYPVMFGGHVEHSDDEHGHLRVRWVPESTIYGHAYDTPIQGYGVFNVNRLRLWKSEARESFDLRAFNAGEYYGAVNDMVAAQNITKVLYPNDEPEAGKALRLRQQYFFVSCSLQDMIRLHLQRASSLDTFADKYAIQLNDTHPVLAIPELMRLIVVEHAMGWDKAYEVTPACMGYTNHTLLPEALETWPLALFKRLLPRLLEIIYELNPRFLDQVRRRYPGDNDRIARMSMI